MDWTAGYASDIEYTAGYYHEQSPALLNFVCLVNGYEPVPLDQPFTYCELGFGRGLTANVLAAANPQGQFYATDFNPAHVAGARELAQAAGLANLTLFEDNFEELARGNGRVLPQFDFITLHGIYTWVTVENQQHIVAFIARYLKPGGIVYLSYNAMPGWAGALPLQRLLVEFGDANPNRSDVQIKGALALIEQLQQAKATYFQPNPALSQRLDMLKTGNTRYLVHEYMHKHWAPLYHADVARDMARAKLDFVGSANLPLAYPVLFLNAEKQAAIHAMSSPAMQETLKDYVLNTSFRKDVFVRGARRMNPVKQAELLSRTRVTLHVERADASLKMRLVVGEVNAHPEIYGPVLDALAERAHTLAELKALPPLKGQSMSNLGQMAALLASSGQVVLSFDDTMKQDCQASRRMNKALSRLIRYGDDYSVLAAAPLGSGIAATFVEMAVYDLVSGNAELNEAQMIDCIWKIMQGQGRNLVKDGAALQGEEANKLELAPQIRAALSLKLPKWKALHMI